MTDPGSLLERRCPIDGESSQRSFDYFESPVQSDSVAWTGAGDTPSGLSSSPGVGPDIPDGGCEVSDERFDVIEVEIVEVGLADHRFQHVEASPR